MPNQCANVTDSLVSKLAPEPQRYEICDTKLPGFRVRVTPTGVITFGVLYRNQHGKRVRYTIGKHGKITTTQARKKAKQLLGEVVIEETDPRERKKAARRSIPTLAAFIAGDYGTWVRANHRTANKTLNRLTGSIGAEFGKTPLNQITAWNLEKWRSKRKKDGIRPDTINRDVATLRSALTKAVKWGVIDIHPLPEIERLSVEDTGRIRYLTPDEEKQLREALALRERLNSEKRNNGNRWRAQRGYKPLDDYADHLLPLALLAINTGCRRGELFNLEWKNVNLPRCMLTVEARTAKSMRTRHVPLNTEAVTLLRNWKRKQTDTTGLVFPSKAGKPLDNVNKAWRGVLEAAKVKDFRWHDLRHHFASKLVMAGVDLNTVRELLGHSDIKMTLRYAHLAPEHKAEAVARLVEGS